METDRYARQTMLPDFGREGQLKLAQGSVLIVGLGGLGSPVATYLACAGVGHLGLADPDTVSLTNLQRQVLYAEAEVGKPKSAVAAGRLHALNSHTRLSLFPEGLTEENMEEIISGFDVVVDCTDNFAARFLIDDACHKLHKPWVHGAIGELCGQVTVLKGRRYADLYPGRQELCSLPRTTSGVIGPVPGVIGSMQACEAISLLVHGESQLDGVLFTIDLKNYQTNLITY